MLIVFALLGGTTTELARILPEAPVAVMAGMPCGMMMSVGHMDHDGSVPPCKGMTPECFKQMGCVTDAILPERFASVERVFSFSSVDYWLARSKLIGRTQTPEPLPPRTI